MAYNNYFPQFYNPTPQFSANTPQFSSNSPQFQQQQLHSTGITWVQGENAAKSYPVGAGQSILLMDSENSVMYIKSTDQSGMPLPLRIFDYTERTQERTDRPQTVAEPKVEYISRNEFEAFRDEIKNEIRQVNKPIVTKATSSKEK